MIFGSIGYVGLAIMFPLMRPRLNEILSKSILFGRSYRYFQTSYHKPQIAREYCLGSSLIVHHNLKINTNIYFTKITILTRSPNGTQNKIS